MGAAVALRAALLRRRLCGMLAVYLDQALVVGLLSAASMGIYAVALSLSRVIARCTARWR